MNYENGNISRGKQKTDYSNEKKNIYFAFVFLLYNVFKKKEDVKYPKQKDEQCCLINQNSSRKDFHPVSLKIGKITVNV